MASISNFWRFYHELRGDLPEAIERYHQAYGPFVRVAPNEINTNAAEVIEVVYKRGGRHYLKSDFYDGFTAVRPNIFGTRDEALHSLRRRQMAHAFSQASLVKMEYIFDRNVRALIKKLNERAKLGEAFNLSDILKFYSQDTNGDLSLGIQFGTQKADDPELVPLLNDHIALAKLTGYVPWTKKWFDKYGKFVPWPYLQQLLRSRALMRAEAARVTDLEFKRVGRIDGVEMKDLPDDDEPNRINLFTSLVRAKDPETGEPIERDDIISNAITFLTAGSHSTAATLEILFWYVAHYPDVLSKMQAEIDDAFGRPVNDEEVLPFVGMEAKLPYTSAVMTECFRIAPTFQHPAPRLAPSNRSSPRYPTVIAGRVIPPRFAVSASVLSLHRNKEIWGEDADKFVPERWLDVSTREKEKLLMHFGAGHRACIGRNQSLIMIWKAVVETIRRLRVAVPGAPAAEEKAELRVCGFAELAESLVVNISKR